MNLERIFENIFKQYLLDFDFCLEILDLFRTISNS